MTKNSQFLIAVVCVIVLSPARVLANGDAKAGQVLFTDRCIACHSAHPTRKPGPLLDGVYGRKAGTAPDYPYSAALRDTSLVWNAQTLDRWLTDPPMFIPGVNMQARVTDLQERQNVIAYLKSISGDGAVTENANFNH